MFPMKMMQEHVTLQLTWMKTMLYAHVCLFNCVFLKDMLSGNNAKTEDLFIDSGSELVHWMNLKGTKNNKTAEKGRLDFMEIL